MNFNIANALVRFFGFRYRMSRNRYFFAIAFFPFFATIPFLGFAMNPITQEADLSRTYWFVPVLAWLICAVALSIRRMHDHGKSAWWLLLYFGAGPAIVVVASYIGWQSISSLCKIIGTLIVMVGMIELIYAPGEAYENKFGPPRVW